MQNFSRLSVKLLFDEGVVERISRVESFNVLYVNPRTVFANCLLGNFSSCSRRLSNGLRLAAYNFRIGSGLKFLMLK